MYNAEKGGSFILLKCIWKRNKRTTYKGLKIPLSRRFFAQITPRNCLKFMFTPSLPNHAFPLGAPCEWDRSGTMSRSKFIARSKIGEIPNALLLEICVLIEKLKRMRGMLVDILLICKLWDFPKWGISNSLGIAGKSSA